jgi:hypothetical protein
MSLPTACHHAPWARIRRNGDTISHTVQGPDGRAVAVRSHITCSARYSGGKGMLPSSRSKWNRFSIRLTDNGVTAATCRLVAIGDILERHMISTRFLTAERVPTAT